MEFIKPATSEMEDDLEKEIRKFALQCALNEFVRVFCEDQNKKNVQMYLGLIGWRYSKLYYHKPHFRKKSICQKIKLYF